MSAPGSSQRAAHSDQATVGLSMTFEDREVTAVHTIRDTNPAAG